MAKLKKINFNKGGFVLGNKGTGSSLKKAKIQREVNKAFSGKGKGGKRGNPNHDSKGRFT